MLRVLVVDDDKLVRKGLISSMPWQAFDMRVVGEANNGQTALEFLEHNQVELLMVDLAMPVMSGIELMQIVSQRYPKIYLVVLTLHQDFQYAQEALRLGAIDYIAKVQLEKEQFEEVLGRISTRIRREQNRASRADQPALSQTLFTAERALAFMSNHEPADTQWIQNIDLPTRSTLEIGNGLWIWAPDDDAAFDNGFPLLEATVNTKDDWVMVELHGLANESRSTIFALLRKYQTKDLFYDNRPDAQLITKTLYELKNQSAAVNENELLALRERWLALHWVYQESLFHQLIADLEKARIPVSKLLPLLSTIQNELMRLCRPIGPLHLRPIDDLHNWADAATWLAAAREQAYLTICRRPYSEEVVGGIVTAMKIVNDEFASSLTAQEIALRINISRSYFNQCFREIIGKPFNDYLRQTRMDRAKEYLLTTDQSIQWVAEHTGYLDEKYFSQVFKEHTGLIPSEFRRNSGAH